MKVLISESQYKVLLLEASRRKINIDLENLKSFAEEVIGKVQEDVGVQFRMLFTWGAAVGGIMGPLNGFIERGDFTVSTFEKALLLVATSAMLFNENKKVIKKLLELINELGLIKTFQKILSKGEELKSSFIEFIQSLNATIYTMTNIMSYTFLIPLLPTLWEIGHSGFDRDDIKDIVTRLLAFGLTSITGVTLKKIITKILERFK
jgi:hypothetical protein